MKKIIIKILKYFGLYETVKVIEIKEVYPKSELKIGDEVATFNGNCMKVTSKPFFQNSIFGLGTNEMIMVQKDGKPEIAISVDSLGKIIR